MTVSGVVKWPPEAPVWSFLWEMNDNEWEGLAFRDVLFRGKKVFHKASLPMIRVQYDSAHGPYKDSLGTGNAPNPVLVHEGAASGFRFVAVECYHRIGNYRIINRWVFWDDGLVQPRLLSRGLQHDSNHRHHVYYRFDFDIETSGNNLGLIHANVGTNWGYGPGWSPRRSEISTFHLGTNTYAVLNKASNRGYKIVHTPTDGFSDAFSRVDIAMTAYHGPEDMKGYLGTAGDDEIWKHINAENIDGGDVVFWYVAHLFHLASEGGDEYHGCGPDLWPFGF